MDSGGKWKVDFVVFIMPRGERIKSTILPRTLQLCIISTTSSPYNSTSWRHLLLCLTWTVGGSSPLPVFTGEAVILYLLPTQSNRTSWLLNCCYYCCCVGWCSSHAIHFRFICDCCSKNPFPYLAFHTDVVTTFAVSRG